MTLNGTWGYSQHDMNWKIAPRRWSATPSTSRPKGGNYLINLGPLADGSIPEAIQVRFHELGAWMSRYGDAIYATTANPLGAVSWGRITAKPGKYYLHVFDWPKDNKITVPVTQAGQVRAYMMADGESRPLLAERNVDGVTITLAPAYQNPYASVAVLEVH